VWWFARQRKDDGKGAEAGKCQLTMFWFYDFLAMLLALDLFYKCPIVVEVEAVSFQICYLQTNFVIYKGIGSL
jgi:hypothetical protein